LGGRREGRQICLLPDARPKPVTGRWHAGGARAPHRAALTGAPTTGRSWSRSRWTFSRTTGLDAVTSLLADGLGKVAAGCFSPTATATPSSQRPRLLPWPARRSAAGAAWRDGFGPHRPLRTSLACLGGVPHRRREEIEGEEREAEGSGTPARRRTRPGRRQRTEEGATTGSFALSVGKGDVFGPNPLTVRDAKDEMSFVFRSPRLETV